MTALTRVHALTMFESVMYVKDAMQPYVNRGFPEVDTDEFMALLLRTIFDAPSEEDRTVPYDYEPAVRMLVVGGLSMELAKVVTKRVLEQLIDMLATHLPHLTFAPGNNATFEIHYGFDLLVTEFLEEDE